MGEVKSAFEKAMEKLNSIEALTPAEREEMKDREEMKQILAAFYKGQLTRDQMWQKFRGMRPSLFKETQRSMADSLRLGLSQEEFRRRKDGILAIESLKQKQNSSALENSMNAIEKLQKEYAQAKERTIKELKTAVEQNPQLRMRSVRTPDGRTAYQTLSVDEAIQTRMSEFLSEHEKKYELMFSQTVDRLKNELR